MKNSILVSVFILLLGLLTACQDGQNNNLGYPTLPFPNVRVEQIPTATVTNTPEAPTPDPNTPTVAAAGVQVQAWPTLDDEEYWISQIDALLDKMERELNSVDTRLKP
ncbi:MAG: hypothetical protein L6461_13240 [Anaerolineae bacterium]|nr:hypothetical protein [Anaerolineae bacterium]